MVSDNAHPQDLGWRRAAPASSLEPWISGLARVGLGLLGLLVVLVLASSVLAHRDGDRAAAARGAEVAAERLAAGMADQHTGLLADRDPALLDSPSLYTQGRQQAERSLVQLRADAEGTPDAGALARLEATVRTWQRWADHERGRPAADRQSTTTATAVANDRRLFGAFAAAEQILVDDLRTESALAEARSRLSTWVALVVAVGGALPVAAALGLFALVVVREGLHPLRGLAGAAAEVAAGRRASIPHADAGDELGQLARALRRWQDESAEWRVLAEAVPLGICETDTDGRLLGANTAVQRMLGFPAEQLVGKPLWAFMHPDDRQNARDRHQDLVTGLVARHQDADRCQ